jgi:hypothetical protein
MKHRCKLPILKLRHISAGFIKKHLRGGGAEFGSMMGFEWTEDLEFYKYAKFLDLVDKY